MKKFLLTAATAFVLHSWLVSCSGVVPLQPVKDFSKIPTVRVLIHQTPQTATVNVQDMTYLYEDATQKIIDSITPGQTMILRRNEQGILETRIGPKIVSGYSRLRVQSAQPQGLLTVNGRRYRGAFRLLKTDSLWTIINILDLESYVKGVVRNEIGKLPENQYEAAKAQAVAARTYAIRKLEKSGREYDMVSDVLDQVYQGAGSETELTNRAVDDTYGEILEYKGKPAQAFYFSTCGGITANVQDVWPSSDTIPYLQSVSNKIDGVYLCRESPYFRWSLSWSGDELETLIKKNLPKIFPKEDHPSLISRRLTDIFVIERDASQRVKKLGIRFETKDFTVTGEQARRLLQGPKTLLYSALFRLDVEKDSGGKITKVTCTGGGYGHGVGMCQWSAKKMASAGYTYRDILLFFFRGLQIQRLY